MLLKPRATNATTMETEILVFERVVLVIKQGVCAAPNGLLVNVGIHRAFVSGIKPQIL